MSRLHASAARVDRTQYAPNGSQVRHGRLRPTPVELVEAMPDVDPRVTTGRYRIPTSCSATAVPQVRGHEPTAPATRPRREPIHLSPGMAVPGTRYRLLRWLGDGGMGVVYEAEHVDIGRRVAVKILRPEVCDDPRVLALFREEARAAARIGSPHIIEVSDFAELPDGRLLYAMELLQGESLARVLAGKTVAVDRTIAILRQVCKGLASAHAARIVHRDIKPDNVFLTERGTRRDIVKLLDFGVAIVLSGPTAIDANILGTPMYLAPELITGRPFDARVDMYALGCTAYEMLTGRPPYQGSVVELLHAHVHTPPPSITTLSRDHGVPVALAAVVVRCLAKQPGDRYADMNDLEAALCEAQIACGLETSWDDLSLPEVEVGRRDLLLQRMPDPTLLSMMSAPRRRRSLLVPAVLAGVLALVGAATTARMLTAAPEVAVDPEVAQLEAEARAAAVRVAFVYPSPDEPTAPTAYAAIRALEDVAGPQSAAAEALAGALRREFAGTLAAFGDRLWERPGGREFAGEAYAQALLFDPDVEPAASRADLTPGQLARLARKAALRDFTETELVAAEPLVVLAGADDAEGAADVQAVRERVAQKRRTAAKQPAAAPTAAPTQPVAPPSTARDPAAAKLLAQARAAVGRGQLDEAERLYERALGHDARNVGALTGLTELYFNRGAYERALSFGARSVKVAPGDAGLRLLVGDAAFKAFEYAAAQAEYQHARRLGHPEADGRLARLATRLGD